MQRNVYRLVTVVLLSSFLMPSPTWAAEGWYGTASGGKAWFESDDFVGGTSGPITQKFGHEYGVGAAIGV